MRLPNTSMRLRCGIAGGLGSSDCAVAVAVGRGGNENSSAVAVAVAVAGSWVVVGWAEAGEVVGCPDASCSFGRSKNPATIRTIPERRKTLNAKLTCNGLTTLKNARSFVIFTTEAILWVIRRSVKPWPDLDRRRMDCTETLVVS